MISREDQGGSFENAAANYAAVIGQANKFAASKGKVEIPVTTHESPMGRGHFRTFEYQFRLVDPNSPEAVSTPMIRRPEVVLQQIEKLLKLDDLRKKGIITEDEFQAHETSNLRGN
jgi:hypothetical protein